MDCDFKQNWDEIKDRMELWWAGKNSDQPVMAMQVAKPNAMPSAATVGWMKSSSGENKVESSTPEDESANYEPFWTDFDGLMQRYTQLFTQFHFTAETYPRFFANLGVASLAVFLGCKPIFTRDTIWYAHEFATLDDAFVRFDENSEWLRWSLDTTRRAKEFAGSRFLAGFPDLTEHLDVLAALMDTQEMMISMMTDAERVHELLRGIQQAWFKVYDMHYDIIRDEDGFSNYGPFQLLGKGKIAKLQCDMSAMISPAMFEEFAVPYLNEQADWLDKSLYHLDGVNAIRHLDMVLGIKSLKALQWTPGAGQPDGGDEAWDFIYQKALDAGKNIYALVAPQNLQRFIKKFGAKGVFIVSGAADETMAQQLIQMARALSAGR